jgi:hypothetical protein
MLDFGVVMVGTVKTKKAGYKERLINLPDELWGVIEADAKAARRSRTAHIEAILVEYFAPSAAPTTGANESAAIDNTGLAAKVSALEAQVKHLTNLITSRLEANDRLEETLHPTDAEIEEELRRLAEQLRKEPLSYGIHVGGSGKMTKAMRETIIEDRIVKRRQELLSERAESARRREAERRKQKAK